MAAVSYLSAAGALIGATLHSTMRSTTVPPARPILRTSRSPAAAALLVALVAAPGLFAADGSPKKPPSPLLLIAGGDSLGQGTMDATNNAVNARNAYLQRIADALREVTPVAFRQPLLDFDGERLFPGRIPTNLAVDGADVFTVDGLEYYQRAGAWFTLPNPDYRVDALWPRDFDSLYDRVLYPINRLAGRPVTQVEAIGELLRAAPAAGVERAAVVLWVGNNDSSQAALGRGGRRPEVQAFPFELIAPELDPLLAGLGEFAEALGLVSFEPYTAAAVERGLTKEFDFGWQYLKIASQIRADAESAGVDADVFLLTLPYYSSVGYLFDSEDLEFYLQKLDPSYTVPPTFARVALPGEPIADVNAGDRVSLLTFGFMYLLLDSGYSVGYVNRALEIDGVQRDGLVLSESERERIQDRLDKFNETIRFNAWLQGPRFHLIDVGATLNEALTGRTEVVIGDKTFSRKWMRGSAFSVDGVHPGYTGQAFIANQGLAAMNNVLGLAAPPYDLVEVAELDPYIDRDGDGFAPLPAYPARGLTEVLFWLRDPDDDDPGVEAEIPADAWARMSAILLEQLVGIPQVEAEAERRGMRRAPRP